MHFFGMRVSYCELRHPTINLFIGFPFTKGHKQSLKLHFICCNLESLYVREFFMKEDVSLFPVESN